MDPRRLFRGTSSCFSSWGSPVPLTFPAGTTPKGSPTNVKKSPLSNAGLQHRPNLFWWVVFFWWGFFCLIMRPKFLCIPSAPWLLKFSAVIPYPRYSFSVYRPFFSKAPLHPPFTTLLFFIEVLLHPPFSPSNGPSPTSGDCLASFFWPFLTFCVNINGALYWLSATFYS